MAPSTALPRVTPPYPALQNKDPSHTSWNCWNSLAVMFELRCSKFELFCSESADNFCAACGRDEERVLMLSWQRPAVRESPRTAAGPIHSCAVHRCVGP